MLPVILLFWDLWWSDYTHRGSRRCRSVCADSDSFLLSVAKLEGALSDFVGECAFLCCGRTSDWRGADPELHRGQ